MKIFAYELYSAPTLASMALKTRSNCSWLISSQGVAFPELMRSKCLLSSSLEAPDSCAPRLNDLWS